MRKTVKEILGVLLWSPTKEREINEHRAWILQSTDKELDEYIQLTTADPILHPMALAERQRRYFRHWTRFWGFIVAFFAMVFAAIAAWPVIRLWIPTSPPSNKDSSFQQPLSNSTPVKPATSQTSPPAIFVNTNLLKK